MLNYLASKIDLKLWRLEVIQGNGVVIIIDYSPIHVMNKHGFWIVEELPAIASCYSCDCMSKIKLTWEANTLKDGKTQIELFDQISDCLIARIN